MVSQFPPFIRPRLAPSYTQQRVHGTGQLFLRKIRTKLVLPAESIASIWRGSSEIVRKYTYSNTETLSFLEFQHDQIVSYCAIVSWKVSEGVKQRYKLWKDVGEIVYAPSYNGEALPSGFAIEIWNTPVTPTVIDDEEIYLSKLILTQLDLCTCALEESNHLRVTTPQGSGILDELGNIILDEGGNWLQPEQ